ncbi:MAG: hypothetical protein Q7S65_02410 [Nanoarchaeota archaeon]|nr:hypothetical protein [Nanoarchaeota archaeon]
MTSAARETGDKIIESELDYHAGAKSHAKRMDARAFAEKKGCLEGLTINPNGATLADLLSRTVVVNVLYVPGDIPDMYLLLALAAGRREVAPDDVGRTLAAMDYGNLRALPVVGKNVGALLDAEGHLSPQISLVSESQLVARVMGFSRDYVAITSGQKSAIVRAYASLRA